MCTNLNNFHCLIIRVNRIGIVEKSKNGLSVLFVISREKEAEIKKEKNARIAHAMAGLIGR